MFDWVLMRYSRKDQQDNVMKQYRQKNLKDHMQFGSKNNLMRMYMDKRMEIIKKAGFTIYDIEQMQV